jgi:antitoxin component YwqK of YwqJK toxin-antitoxin module
MKGVLLLSLLLSVSFIAFCQEKPGIYYFDKDLNVTTKSSALFKGAGIMENNLFRLDIYNKTDNYHICTAHYTDSTLAVIDGRFISYYRNGVIENLSYYKKGIPDGLWLKWDSDQRIIDSVWYKNGQPDSSVNLYYSFSHKLASIERDNFIDSSSVITRFDQYGHLITPGIADTTRKEDRVITEKPDNEVLFPGGDSAMNVYFKDQFSRYKLDLLASAAAEKCHVKFAVDKTGMASDVVSEGCDNFVFARIFKQAVARVKWLPARKNGKPVKAVKEVAAEFYPSLDGMTVSGEKKYYFDDQLNPAEQDAATYFGKITSEDNLVKLTVHYNRHSNKIFSMHFTDFSLQSGNGEFESFYYDDQKKMRGNFLLGRKNGVWVQWDQTGRVVDSSVYNIGIKTAESVLNYQPGGALAHLVAFDYNARTIRHIFYDKKNITADLIIKLDVDDDDDDDTAKIFDKVEVEPSFPGGPDAWSKYIDTYINNNIGKIHREGTCVVRFVVDSSGKVSHVEALTRQGTSLAKIAVKGISESPDWIPATQHGKKVKAYRMQPISFTVIRL